MIRGNFLALAAFLMAVSSQTFGAGFSGQGSLLPAPAKVQQRFVETTIAPAIVAASAQDAVNAYVRKRRAGFTELQFPSGFGYAATGKGTYTKRASTVAARMDQRNAYAKAYINARENLAEGLYGLSNEEKNRLVDPMSAIDGMPTNLSEKIDPIVYGMLRGFTVYAIHDDFDNNAVYVTVVTVPKAQGDVQRGCYCQFGPGWLDAGDRGNPQSGSAPTSEKIVFISQTGRFTIVPVEARKFDPIAEHRAKIRAADSLCGVVLSHRTEGSADLVDVMEDFEVLERSVPLYRTLTERKRGFLDKGMVSSSADNRKKDVKTQTWRDDYGWAAYADRVATGR